MGPAQNARGPASHSLVSGNNYRYRWRAGVLGHFATEEGSRLSPLKSGRLQRVSSDNQDDASVNQDGTVGCRREGVARPTAAQRRCCILVAKRKYMFRLDASHL